MSFFSTITNSVADILGGRSDDVVMFQYVGYVVRYSGAMSPLTSFSHLITSVPSIRGIQFQLTDTPASASDFADWQEDHKQAKNELLSALARKRLTYLETQAKLSKQVARLIFQISTTRLTAEQVESIKRAIDDFVAKTFYGRDLLASDRLSTEQIKVAVGDAPSMKAAKNNQTWSLELPTRVLCKEHFMIRPLLAEFRNNGGKGVLRASLQLAPFDAAAVIHVLKGFKAYPHLEQYAGCLLYAATYQLELIESSDTKSAALLQSLAKKYNIAMAGSSSPRLSESLSKLRKRGVPLYPDSALKHLILAGESIDSTSEYKGGSILKSKRGAPYSLSLFRNWTNSNMLILGATGSGKRFLAQDQLLSTLSQGGRVVIIDNNGNYSKLVDAVGGKIITLNEAGSFGLDLLQVVSNIDESSYTDVFSTLIPWLASILRFESSDMDNILHLLAAEFQEWFVHAKPEERKLSIFAQVLRTSAYQQLRELEPKLVQFIQGGKLYNQFKELPSFPDDTSCVVFDLSQWKHHPDQRIISNSLVSFVSLQWLTPRKDGKYPPKLLMLDNMSLMGNNCYSLQNYARAARLYVCGLLVLVTEQESLKVDEVLLNSFSKKVVLPISENLLPALTFKGVIPSSAHTHVTNLAHSKGGSRSPELWLQAEDVTGEFSFPLDVISKVLFSRNHDITTEYWQLRRKNGASTVEALKEIALKM